MTRGTPAAGKKHTHSHMISRFTGRSNFHKQNKKDAQSGGGVHAKKRRYNWSVKAKRRNTTGTGRCRYVKHVNRKEKNGYPPAARLPRRSRPRPPLETAE